MSRLRVLQVRLPGTLMRAVLACLACAALVAGFALGTGVPPASAQAFPPCPDRDGDHYADCTGGACDSTGLQCGDCNDADVTSWQSPSEVDSLQGTHDRTTGITTWSWSPPAQSGGSIVRYDVLRSFPGDSYHGFGASSSCAETNDSSDTAWVEPPAVLPPGQFAAYVVRARNGCYGTNVHNIGHASNGTTREGRACP